MTSVCNILLEALPPDIALPDSVVQRLGAKFTVVEVKDALKALHSNKSADADGITAELLRLAVDEWAELLTLSFNVALEIGQLSAKQRFGITSFLYKKKDPRDLRNWRPLTIRRPSEAWR